MTLNEFTGTIWSVNDFSAVPDMETVIFGVIVVSKDGKKSFRLVVR